MPLESIIASEVGILSHSAGSAHQFQDAASVLKKFVITLCLNPVITADSHFNIEGGQITQGSRQASTKKMMTQV